MNDGKRAVIIAASGLFSFDAIGVAVIEPLKGLTKLWADMVDIMGSPVNADVGLVAIAWLAVVRAGRAIAAPLTWTRGGAENRTDAMGKLDWRALAGTARLRFPLRRIRDGGFSMSSNSWPVHWKRAWWCSRRKLRCLALHVQALEDHLVGISLFSFLSISEMLTCWKSPSWHRHVSSSWHEVTYLEFSQHRTAHAARWR